MSLPPYLRRNLTLVVVAFLVADTTFFAASGFLRAQTASAGSSQTRPQSQNPQTGPGANGASLTVNVRMVVLDVVVADRSGNPVDGLTAEDFHVFEDGQLQQIRTLELPSAHILPPRSVAAGASAEFEPARPESFGKSPVNILMLDQLNTHFADSAFARNSMREYLATQPALLAQPTTLLSLSENGLKQLQQFTRDRDSVSKALAAAPTRYAWKLESDGKANHGPIERLDQSLRALEDIAQNYARIPGRKNLIWIGGGFPTLDPTSLAGNDLQEVKDTLQHVTDVLLDTHITLYAVDPGSSAAGMNEVVDVSQQAFVDAGGDALGGGTDPFSAGEDFDKLGPVTGGRVIRGRNDVTHQIASALETGARFYTISYTPNSSNQSAAKYRNIRVECLRPGLSATTRSGYYSGKTQQRNSANSAAYDLTAAAESSAPLNGIRLSVEPDTTPEAAPYTFIVRANVSNLNWTAKPDGGALASVYILAVSLGSKRQMLGHTLHGMTAVAQSGANLQDETRTADFRLIAPPAARSSVLRFIVRDSATGRMGSVDVPLQRSELTK